MNWLMALVLLAAGYAWMLLVKRQMELNTPTRAGAEQLDELAADGDAERLGSGTDPYPYNRIVSIKHDFYYDQPPAS
ncbi:MAG TPA: hypothetical protein VGH11_13495 [Jatrophihabitans sp.]|jgi:hypothetical protein